jgi:hypothetical protein
MLLPDRLGVVFVFVLIVFCVGEDDWLKKNLELAAQGDKQPLHGGDLLRCTSGFGCTKPREFDAPSDPPNDPAWDLVQQYIREQNAWTYTATKESDWKCNKYCYDKYTISLYRDYPSSNGYIATTWFNTYPDANTIWRQYNAGSYPISLEHDLQYPFLSPLRSVQTAWLVSTTKWFIYFDVQVGYIAWGKSGATCRNGFYAARMLLSISFSLYSLAVEYPTCVPCQVGTWNTCQSFANCTYPVQHIGESFLLWRKRVKLTYSSDINLPATNQELSLVGSCLPCRDSIFSNTHFGMTMMGYGLMFNYNSEAIPYRCLGGDFPPLPCGNNALAPVDSLGRAVRCACGAGTYDKSSGVSYEMLSYTKVQPDVSCVPCDPGYACSGASRRICSVGEFSTGGASSCTLCTRDHCPDPRQLRPICESGSVRDEIVCVSCRQCKNFGNRNGKLCYGAVDIDLSNSTL